MSKGRNTVGNKNDDSAKKKIRLSVQPLGGAQSVDPLRPKKIPGLCITSAPGNG
jgi:hypothetical protein